MDYERMYTMKKGLFTQGTNYGNAFIKPDKFGPMFDPNDPGGDITPPQGDPTPQGDPVPPAFDPSNLSPEMQAFVDKERTRAAKTAAKNARTQLEGDDEFLTSMRERIEREQNLTVEEKMAARDLEIKQREDAILLRENNLLTVKSLMDGGIASEEADKLASLLTTTDADASTENVENFLALFDKALTTGVEKMKQELLKNGHQLHSSGSNVGGYQAQYDQAKKDKNTAAMIKIKREAFEKEKLVLN